MQPYADIIAYVVNHWDLIAAVMYAIHALAVAIINLTTSPPEGDGTMRTAHRTAYRALEISAGLITPKAKR